MKYDHGILLNEYGKETRMRIFYTGKPDKFSDHHRWFGVWLDRWYRHKLLMNFEPFYYMTTTKYIITYYKCNARTRSFYVNATLTRAHCAVIIILTFHASSKTTNQQIKREEDEHVFIAKASIFTRQNNGLCTNKHTHTHSGHNIYNSYAFDMNSITEKPSNVIIK